MLSFLKPLKHFICENTSTEDNETRKGVLLSSLPSLRKQQIGINNEPQHFENELCEGKVLVMLRPTNLKSGESWRYSNWFRGKSRKMEIQVQLRLKSDVPPQSLWVCVVPTPLERVNLNILTSAFCRIILACISHFLGVDFKWSLGGNGETPHMSLPASSMLSLLVTEPGQTLPCLGTDDMRQVPANASQIRKEWAKATPLDSKHTYTFTFYSKYLDLSQWAVVEIPGVGRVSLETFWPGASSIDIVLQEERPSGPRTYLHLQSSRSAACLLHHTPTVLDDAGRCGTNLDSWPVTSSNEPAGLSEKVRSCCLADLLGCFCANDVHNHSRPAVVSISGIPDMGKQNRKMSIEKLKPKKKHRQWEQLLCMIVLVAFMFALRWSDAETALKYVHGN